MSSKLKNYEIVSHMTYSDLTCTLKFSLYIRRSYGVTKKLLDRERSYLR